MSAPNYSVRLKPELRSWLDEEAKRQERSSAYVVNTAIENLKNQSEAKDRMIQKALAEADKGEFISEEKATEWFMSLGSEQELPMPEPDVFLKAE